MPMIELTLLAGAVEGDRLSDLVERLGRAVAKWEGMADTPQVSAAVWTFVDERPPGAVTALGRPLDEPRYRVQVTVAEGSLDDGRKAGLVADITGLVLAAEGRGAGPADAARVWCHVHELRDGNWGAAGRIWRLDDIVGFAGIDRSTLPGRTG